MLLCIKNVEHKQKALTRIALDTQFIDIGSINQFWQRLETEELRKTLHSLYFTRIIDALIVNAESIALERRVFALQEELSVNKLAIMNRARLMRELSTNIRREDLLRMKRSALNKIYFPHSRRKLLEQIFCSWVRFFQWNRGHREAFEVKYEVIRNRMEIDRQYRQATDAKTNDKRKDVMGIPLPKESQKRTDTMTIMQQHHERPVQCRNCFVFYLEAQNISTACRYHKDEFIFSCPKSCEHQGASKLCIIHKMKRWACCDAIDANTVGCCLKYHVPVAEDAFYNSILEGIRTKNLHTLVDLTKKSDQLVEAGWMEKHDKMKRRQLNAIERGLEEDRRLLDRFEN